jgi:hypothetical protein
MIIDLVVCRAVDVLIAIQKSMREAQVNRADFVEPKIYIILSNL